MPGKIVETEEIPAYCAVALAELKNFPDTILSRSVVIRMRKRSPDETVELYRRRLHSATGFAILDRLGEWAEHAAQSLKAFHPELPGTIVHRDAVS